MKMDRYDICITALPGDAEMAGALRDSIFHFRLPKGTVLSTEPGYNRIVMDLTGSEIARSTERREPVAGQTKRERR